MDSSSGQSTAGLIQALESHPREFSFFQAVRLLEVLRGAPRGLAPLGYDHDPTSEAVALRSRPGLGFPSCELSTLVTDPGAQGTALFGPAEATTPLLGLIGPLGTLPQFYNELVLQRTYYRDESLRDFLDLLHHRALSLFYRAWRKYRLAPAYEHSHHFGTGPDPGTNLLLSLVGLGTPALADARGVEPLSWVFFGAHFAQGRRSQVDLESLVSEALHTPVRVEQFVGRWIPLDEDVRTRLPGKRKPGANHRLGQDLVLGERVWDVQSKVRIEIGPASLATFLSLQAGGSAARGITDLVRSYLDASIDFELEVTLDPDEVPALQLGSAREPARLGQTTWLPASDAARLDASVRISIDRF